MVSFLPSQIPLWSCVFLLLHTLYGIRLITCVQLQSYIARFIALVLDYSLIRPQDYKVSWCSQVYSFHPIVESLIKSTNSKSTHRLLEPIQTLATTILILIMKLLLLTAMSALFVVNGSYAVSEDSSEVSTYHMHTFCTSYDYFCHLP